VSLDKIEKAFNVFLVIFTVWFAYEQAASTELRSRIVGFVAFAFAIAWVGIMFWGIFFRKPRPLNPQTEKQEAEPVAYKKAVLQNQFEIASDLLWRYRDQSTAQWWQESNSRWFRHTTNAIAAYRGIPYREAENLMADSTAMEHPDDPKEYLSRQMRLIKSLLVG
jgi:hypothetical protein